MNVNAYVARTVTPGLTGQNTSYHAQFDYPGDRYGLRVEHLLVGRHFNPEMGLLRRSNFRRTFAEGRFSPRPRALPAIRQFTFEGSADYFATADTGLMESRQRLFSFESEFQNSDRFELDFVDQYERLDTPFEIVGGVEIPAGGYGFRHLELVHTFGRQRRASGQLLFRRGGFYNGRITVLEFTSGRFEANGRLSFEPSLSINKIALPEAAATTTTLVRGRLTYTFTPRMFLSGLLQFNTENDRLSTNLRLRWEYRPGSELFVVYSEDRDRDGRAIGLAQPRSRGLAVKINRLFRY